VNSIFSKEILSPNFGNFTAEGWKGERLFRITKYTVHHAAVKATAEAIAKSFLSPEREASANAIIGSDGEIILCVPPQFRAWTSGNAENDNMAFTVEVCNSTGAPEWRVSDKALEAVINLGVWVCKENGLGGFKWTGDANGTLTIHKMFQATACPGPYLESKMPYIAEEITRRVQEENNMVFSINLEELKSKGYTEVKIELGKAAPVVPEVPTPDPIKVGDLVRMSKDATVYGQTNKFSDFVYNAYLYVRELNGSRAVVSTTPVGAVTGPVDVKYLTKV
jgi:hypothetical protein